MAKVLVDTSPTPIQLIAGLERTLEWMREHNIDHLSPFEDYQRPIDTLRVVYKAMIEAALD
jgi:hypothetical protein